MDQKKGLEKVKTLPDAEGPKLSALSQFTRAVVSSSKVILFVAEKPMSARKKALFTGSFTVTSYNPTMIGKKAVDCENTVIWLDMSRTECQEWYARNVNEDYVCSIGLYTYDENQPFMRDCTYTFKSSILRSPDTVFSGIAALIDSLSFGEMKLNMQPDSHLVQILNVAKRKLLNADPLERAPVKRYKISH